jgi:hypothetical protein
MQRSPIGRDFGAGFLRASPIPAAAFEAQVGGQIHRAGPNFGPAVGL